MALRNKSASLSTIQRHVDSRICFTNHSYDITRGEYKLSNDIHVAYLKARPGQPGCLIIGNVRIHPDMPQGAALYDLFVSYLCKKDAEVVQTLSEALLGDLLREKGLINHEQSNSTGH